MLVITNIKQLGFYRRYPQRMVLSELGFGPPAEIGCFDGFDFMGWLGLHSGPIVF
jgi:hypothetical protein